MSASSSTPSGRRLGVEHHLGHEFERRAPGVRVDRRLAVGAQEVAARLLVEGVQPGRGLDALLAGDQRAPDPGRGVGRLLGEVEILVPARRRRLQAGLLEQVGAVIHGAVVHHDRQRHERALVAHRLDRGLAEVAAVGVGHMRGQVLDEALLVELRQPHLVGDVDVEAAGARQRVEHELLADVVVRDRDELDLDAGGLGELGGVLLVERVVGRSRFHAGHDLAGCGERLPMKGSGRLAPAAAAAPALSRCRLVIIVPPFAVSQSHSGTHCGSFTLRDPGRVSALIRVISASVSAKSKTSRFSCQPLGPRRLRDGDDVGLLDEPAQRHLGGRAAVRAGDRLDHGIADDLAERDRAIGDDRHAAPAQRREHLRLVRYGWYSICSAAKGSLVRRQASSSSRLVKFDRPMCRAARPASPR